ncbi:hypothetical protein [Streptomyces sp. Isolate_45]|nr:hypothetical protein [Streptomyces sp. Isolate_45]MDA5284299.1 hypothetical protein [Streptomyces sp. Isolate_45]
MDRLPGRDPWGWRQQLAVLLYVLAVSVLVITLAIAGTPRS